MAMHKVTFLPMNLTVEVEDTSDTQYIDASGILDVIMGKLGKQSAEAKNLQRLRTELQSRSKQPTPPPPPAPQ